MELTSQPLDPLRMALLIASGGFAYGFVAGCQGYDAEEGDDEGECGGYAPGGEDYAEVFCGPGEEHLLVVSGVNEEAASKNGRKRKG